MFNKGRRYVSRKINDEIPISKINRHYYIVCPYCSKIHTHGSQGGGGERGPHCTNSQPNIYTIE